MSEYNGWSNYATFRVAHDILNNIAFDDFVNIGELKEIVKSVVLSNLSGHFLATDYINLFLNTVDWVELADVYNTDIATEKLNLQTCCICLEEQTEFDIENDNRLIEYNHCGSYYVHNKCLNTWNLNECLICRKNFNASSNQYCNEITNDNNIITILTNQNDESLNIKQFCLNLCIITNLFGIGLYFLLKNQ